MHPLTDPGDGRVECQPCGKWVWLVTHSCKGIPVTAAAMARDPRFAARLTPRLEPHHLVAREHADDEHGFWCRHREETAWTR